MIPFYRGLVPYLTTDQMREVDRLMIEVYRIELIQMMENAGRNLAHLARVRFFDGDPTDRRVLLLAGTGGNGGGALVCARWLHNAGAAVRVVLSAPAERLTPVAAHQLTILENMRIPVTLSDSLDDQPPPDLIVDGLIGYSLSGAPRGDTARLINWANASDSPILALDVPSGLDTITGRVFAPAIRASAAMTLALPKEGLVSDAARSVIGELYLANIGVPRELYAEASLELTVDAIFRHSDIVRLW